MKTGPFQCGEFPVLACLYPEWIVMARGCSAEGIYKINMTMVYAAT
jgi:hypothetical protein